VRKIALRVANYFLYFSMYLRKISKYFLPMHTAFSPHFSQ